MKRVPELMLERLRLGELTPDQARLVRERLAAEPGGLARLAALEAAEVDDAATVQRRPLRAQESPRWLLLGAPLLVAIVAVVLLVRTPREETWLRAKGDVKPALVLYRQTPTGYDVLVDGARVAPGDVLQLAYVAAGREIGALVSLDGRGATTVHLPVGPLKQGGEVRLPQGYALDDAPDFERFVLMTFEANVGLELTTVTVVK